MIKQTIIAIGMMTFAGVALAGGGSFAKVDANGNGKISWSEAKAAGIPQSNFMAADAHGDGVLDKEDYKSAVSHWALYGGDAMAVANAQSE